MGPMAQDFHAAFGLGADDRHIHVLDSSGVALASIQALNDRLQALECENAELRAENATVIEALQRIEQHLSTLGQTRADK
jgi:hypothetical protein